MKKGKNAKAKGQSMGEETSFAKEEPREEKEAEQTQEEDLSMFERDLTLPEEGAMCVDSNLHAAKYLMVQLMNRINKNMNTWWKFNIATDRKGKLQNWKKGFRPDVTGKDYPVKDVDPMTGTRTPFASGVTSKDSNRSNLTQRKWSQVAAILQLVHMKFTDSSTRFDGQFIRIGIESRRLG